MKCQKCNFQNESDASFCGKCGSPLRQTNNSLPSRITQHVSPGQLNCLACGAINEPNNQFCYNCGSQIEPSQTETRRTDSRGKTSGAWWLMPIFLGWVGGLVAWLVVRETDRSKAKKLLWTGIIISILWFIIIILANTMAFFIGTF